MKKIMAIIGSPRKGGNTEALTDKMVEGCKSRGEVEVEKFFIIDKDIKYCSGCLTCVNPGEEKCVIKDDMEGILERMEECEGFIFATPNHVRSVTAPMLNFLTRMLPLLEVKVERDSEGNIVGGGFNSRLEGKKAAMVISQGDPIISSFLVFELLERNFIDYNLLRIGEEKEQSIVVQSELEDKKGIRYTMREPLDPGEIGQLYRLFFEENYPKSISEMDKHFVVTDSRNKVVAGLCYIILENDTVLLDGSAVTTALKGRGIGSAMIENFCGQMAGLGAKVIKAHFLMGNFYLKLNFKVDKKWGALVRFL